MRQLPRSSVRSELLQVTATLARRWLGRAQRFVGSHVAGDDLSGSKLPAPVVNVSRGPKLKQFNLAQGDAAMQSFRIIRFARSPCSSCRMVPGCAREVSSWPTTKRMHPWALGDESRTFIPTQGPAERAKVRGRWSFSVCTEGTSQGLLERPRGQRQNSVEI